MESALRGHLRGLPLHAERGQTGGSWVKRLTTTRLATSCSSSQVAKTRRSVHALPTGVFSLIRPLRLPRVGIVVVVRQHLARAILQSCSVASLRKLTLMGMAHSRPWN